MIGRSVMRIQYALHNFSGDAISNCWPHKILPNTSPKSSVIVVNLFVIVLIALLPITNYNPSAWALPPLSDVWLAQV